MFGYIHEFFHDVKVYILAPYGGTFRIHSIKWIKQSKDSFDYNKATYIVNLKKAIMSKRNNPILFYVLNNPQPMEICEVTSKWTPTVTGSARELRAVIEDNSTKEILNEGQSEKMLLVVGVFVVLIIVIAGVAMYLLTQQSKEIAELSIKLAQVYANSTKTGGVVVIP